MDEDNVGDRAFAIKRLQRLAHESLNHLTVAELKVMKDRFITDPDTIERIEILIRKKQKQA